jgi:CxxC motif-containing protein (DUF1111 family)
MKLIRKLVTASLILPTSLILAACSASETGVPAADDPAADPGVATAVQEEGDGVHVNAITEAPTGFDNLTNGFSTQANMDAARDVFANEVEEIADGLGPLYNAQSCRECHQSPSLGNAVGGSSQVTELRAGHFNGTSFVDAAGGSLISDRAIAPGWQEQVGTGNEVRTFRISLSIFGDGFVESIDSNTLAAISTNQPAAQRGTFIQVPVLEAGGALRGGRFGWKAQNASLLSFAADAYVNEEGITSPLLTAESTSNGRSTATIDTVADPEDVGGADIAQFALFMRSLKAPPRGSTANSTSAVNGSTLFTQTGCVVCHVRTITTAPAGTVINQGAFTVPTSLGDKNIHPFCDFLLHDVGTGDGIVQNGGQSTANKLRTAPLWGVRTRGRLMHDGETTNRTEAILRHAGEANGVINNFRNLSATQRNQLVTFLQSL